jgi:hypothetical protein
MFSWLSRIDLAGSRSARMALNILILADICAGWAAGAHAQGDVKAIVKIVTSGTIFENNVRAVPGTYVGSGFIVHSMESRGERETVIVTADHVLGYSQRKANDPDNITFKKGEVENPPPVWVNRDHDLCLAELRVPSKTPESSEPCRRIEIFYLDNGKWVPYNREPLILLPGDKNRDATVLLLKFAHNDQRRLEIGRGFSLNEAAERERSIPLSSFRAWGIESSKPENDPSATELSYRWRNDGPTLLFQPSVEPGNSGGPIMLEGKVIGIVSGVQRGETRRTNISTVYGALSSFDIPAVQQADRVPASQLLRQIRCETRNSIKRILIEWLSALGSRANDPIASQLALQYQNDPELISTFNYNLFQGAFYAQVREVMRSFHDAGIAYAFESYPRFTSTDSFGFLLTSLGQPSPGGIRYCDGVIATSDSGRTGVDRLIRDFLQLSVFGNLGGAGDRAPPTMVDLLRYTSSAGRTDTHTVTVALAISTARNSERDARRHAVVVGDRLTGRGNTASELLALLAIDQVKNRPAQPP